MSAAVLALSCAKELTDNQEANYGEYKTVTFESVATKTTLADNGQVSWEAGDEISVYYLNAAGAAVEAVATAAEAGATATFTAQIPVDDNPTEYYAAYPKGAGILKEDGSFSINVLASECDGTFKDANFAAAYTSAEQMSFNFKNAVGMFKVTLPEGAVVTRPKTGAAYPVTGIYIRCKKSSVKLNGELAVTVTDGNVTDFAASGSAANINMTKLSAAAISSGVIYVPCTPASWDDGICVRYLSSAGDIPAVLSKDVEISVARGQIVPLGDLASKVVFDYYVSAAGEGNGLTAATPMSVSKMVEMISSTDATQAQAYNLRGSVFNFTEGTHTLESTISIAHAANQGYKARITGNNNAVLTGSGVKVFDVKGNAEISDLTIQDTDVTSLSGAAANGAAVTVNTKTIVALKNLTLQNNKAKQGGAIFINHDSKSTDENSILDVDNCKFLSNVTTGGGGAVVTASAAAGGLARFNYCYFKHNSAADGGALKANGPTYAMFNKCTFFENSADLTQKNYAREITMTATFYNTRLAMNNCTVRGKNGSNTNGAIVVNKGYSIIANTTMWSNGAVGSWGVFALGCHVNNSDTNGAVLVNSIFVNKEATTKPGIYLNTNYYTNIHHCITTGYTENISTATISNTHDLGIGGYFGSTGLGVTKNDEGDNLAAVNPYYAYTWPFAEGYPCPTLEEVRTLIASNTKIGGAFLNWLDTLEGALTTDIAGRPRSEDAICPGAYQQKTTPAGK